MTVFVGGVAIGALFAAWVYTALQGCEPSLQEPQRRDLHPAQIAQIAQRFAGLAQ